MALYGAYNQRSARFRRRPMPNLGDQMAMDGREQSTSGNYKTRPGAPMSARDSTPTGVPGVSGGFTPDSTWNNFFISHQKDSGVKPLPDIAPDSGLTGADIAPPPGDAFYEATVTASDPNSYLKATQASQDKYFGAFGQPIARPQPGAVNPGTGALSVPSYGTSIPPLPSPQSLASNAPDFGAPDFSSIPDFSTFDTQL